MSIKIPQKSISYIIACVSAITILVIACIIPLNRAMTHREELLAEKSLKLDEQRLLLPVHQALQQRLEKKRVRALPLPAQSQMPKDQIGKVDEDLRELSGKAKIELISFTPSLLAAEDKPNSITAEAVIQGEFFQMRNFLSGLAGIPYLERIEEVRISRTPDFMEMRIKFRVARS